MPNKLYKRHITIVPIAVLIGITLLTPIITSNAYYLQLLISVYILIILSSGLRLMANVEALSIAQAAFFGIGAYTSALLMTKMSWNFWLTLPCAGIVSGLVAIVVGLPTLRLRGVYFILVTTALNEVIRMIWINWPDAFGGIGGVINIPRPGAIFGLTFGDLRFFYYLPLILMFLTIAVMSRIDRSRYGLLLQGIAQCEEVAQSVGLNVMRFKVEVFFTASFFAGLAGAIFASLQRAIFPDDFHFLLSVDILVYAVVGGLKDRFGPVCGVVFLMGLSFVLKQIPNYDPKVEPLILGSFLIIAVIGFPGGLVSLPQRIRSVVRDRRAEVN
jgi:branched-chain amino acid transport system permease protein